MTLLHNKLQRMQALADELVRRSRGENQQVAMELRELLTPPSLAELLMSIPGETKRDKYEAIGMSHQGFYNLLNGVSRPNTRTAAKLAKLTGLTPEAIRQAGP